VTAPKLTPTQRRVAALLAAGHPTHFVAAQLHISRSTLRCHVNTIAAKIPAEHQGIRFALITPLARVRVFFAGTSIAA